MKNVSSHIIYVLYRFRIIFYENISNYSLKLCSSLTSYCPLLYKPRSFSLNMSLLTKFVTNGCNRFLHSSAFLNSELQHYFNFRGTNLWILLFSLFFFPTFCSVPLFLSIHIYYLLLFPFFLF